MIEEHGGLSVIALVMGFHPCYSKANIPALESHRRNSSSSGRSMPTSPRSSAKVGSEKSSQRFAKDPTRIIAV